MLGAAAVTADLVRASVGGGRPFSVDTSSGAVSSCAPQLACQRRRCQPAIAPSGTLILPRWHPCMSRTPSGKLKATHRV